MKSFRNRISLRPVSLNSRNNSGDECMTGAESKKVDFADAIAATLMHN